MSFKAYFKGKNGASLWLNVLAMIALIVVIPTLIFLSLGFFTHHGEKIEVPDVCTMSMERARSVLEKEGFQVVIADSVDSATIKNPKTGKIEQIRPGAVLEQTPKAGTKIKSGRIVYLVTRYKNEVCIEIPEGFNKYSYRVGKKVLENLGLTFTPDSLIDEYDEEVIIGLYQGKKRVHSGDRIPKSRPLTYFIGSGVIHEPDTIERDTILEKREYIIE